MDLQELSLAVFAETGVLCRGHFALTSGRHSDQYMQCIRVFEQADKAERLCRALAGLYADDGIDVVMGLAIGSIQMAYEVSRHLGCKNMFTERVEGRMALRRGFAPDPGARVLIVEDAVTTGGTIREVITLLRDMSITVAGVGALVDRSGGRVDFGVPFRALATLSIDSWEAESCPLCARGLPVTKPGSRPGQA